MGVNYWLLANWEPVLQVRNRFFFGSSGSSSPVVDRPPLEGTITFEDLQQFLRGMEGPVDVMEGTPCWRPHKNQPVM